MICNNFANVLKRKNLNKYIALFTPLTYYLAEAPVQPQVFFGYEATSFAHLHLAIFCHFFPHLLHLKLCQVGWGGETFQFLLEMFDWVQGRTIRGHSQSCP